MKEFLLYIWGQGETPEFALFTPAHFAPILLMLAVILLTRKFADRIREWKHEEGIRYFLAFALICSEMAYYWRLVALPELGPNPVDNLPIAVCGWAAIFGSYMVVGKNQKHFDIIYFWLLSGSLFALLVMTAIACTNRLIPGANYLYMARPESAPSVLDILPPNFLLRFAVMFAVITAMYGLAYLPWHLKDKKAQ